VELGILKTYFELVSPIISTEDAYGA